MHVPVLPDEVLALLEPQRGGTFVDCTVGLGGHSRLMLERGAARLIGIDRDTDALARARQALEPFADRVYDNLQIRKDKEGKVLVQYIQTTTGRVIFNYTIQKTLNLIL